MYGTKADERVKRRMPTLSIDMPMSVLRQKLNLENDRKIQAFRAAANRNYLNDIGKREIRRNARRARKTEAQDAFAVHQQPNGSAPSTAAARSGPQTDARGKPETGGRQQSLPAERWQTRFLGKHGAITLRQLNNEEKILFSVNASLNVNHMTMRQSN
ncbi:jg12826 [Pararge aegeria aegeria]|uniref:Jg12826 protein n=1 Tax=Pararge aegeria aegeria TaxID=348720 RepID=A0A8S4RMW7_9NEOP|nr:jg12826 [Pararge aegeria aegeria]